MNPLRPLQIIRQHFAVHATLPVVVSLLCLLYSEPAQCVSPEPRLISWGPEGGVIEIGTEGYTLGPVQRDGAAYEELELPGAVWLPRSGYPAVPVRGVLLGIPHGAEVRVQVIDAVYTELPGINLMPVPDAEWLGRDFLQYPRPVFTPDEAAYSTDAFYPAEAAELVELALIRDQQVASISLRPIQYNPARRVLRLATRLRVQVTVLPRAATRPMGPGDAMTDSFAPIYDTSLLNAEASRPLRRRPPARQQTAARKQAADWYIPGEAYYRILISEDGVYQLDPEWFEATGMVLGPGDLERLKLFVDGVEVLLDVDDGGDGVLDAGDRVTFVGRFRRALDRDFESEYGAQNSYWLTTAGGGRTAPANVDAAPANSFPIATWFLSQVHAEVDSLYEPLGLADDAERDHWYWARTGSPLGSIPEFPFVRPLMLPGLDRGATLGGADGDPVEVRIRAGMHGLTTREAFSQDHRTVVRVSNGTDTTEVADDRWDGQSTFVASGTLPAGLLSEASEVTVTTPGSSDFPENYVDNILVNWVEVQYPRRYEAEAGMLMFDPGLPGESRTVTIDGFRDSNVRVYDLERNQMLIPEVTSSGDGIQARFELPEASGVFAVADRGALRTPAPGTLLAGSTAREDLSGADYVIVTHGSLREQADRLAAHRSLTGLVTRVVDVEEVYGAFSFGQMTPNAIQDFLQFAFENWSRRPVYAVMFGRASYDYRDIFGQASTGRRNLVPTLPVFVSVRGLAFTDHFYSTISGDDGFPDLYLGRLSVASPEQAATVVGKIEAYDGLPDAAWRDRMLLMANIDAFFTDPSDSMIARYVDPVGIEAFRAYQTVDPDPEPNASTARVTEQWNEGRLMVNFMGHGSAAIMSTFLRGTSQQGNYNYMIRIANGERLPMVIAMSCLNGLFAEPRLTSLSEEMVNKENGGAIAYASASSLAFVFSNAQLNDAMLKRTFQDDMLAFGQSLSQAKIDVLTSFPGLERAVFVLNLIGDPAQLLAIPSGPDYAVDEDGLRVLAAEPLVARDTVLVRVRLLNRGVISTDMLPVSIVDVNEDIGTTDTLFAAVLPAFGHTDSLTIAWPLSGRAGRHRLELVLDGSQAVDEWDETNNRADLNVEVVGPLTAETTVPADGQVMTPASLRLGIRSGLGAGQASAGEFEISETGVFDNGVLRSGSLAATDGFVNWQPSGLPEGAYYWRARLIGSAEAGSWTPVQIFTVASVTDEREVLWQQDGSQALSQGDGADVTLFAGGRLGRVDEPPPMRFTADTRLEAFPAQNVAGTAALATDGTHLFVKGFFSEPRIYPGTDVFRKIGSGFGGTVAGEDLGAPSDVAVPGVSATYHQGFLYGGHGKRDELTRISPLTGATDTVAVPDGLLNVQLGLVTNGSTLITSDGTYVYNAAWGIDGVRRAGWIVRVFDPADNWRVVREFEVAPTSTGFTYMFTDGLIADGRYLYLVEFSTGLTHRVRVVDAVDGHFITEFQSDQMETDILSGQYDPVNNRVWFGQLEGNGIVSYQGLTLPAFGSLTSSTVGPASVWDHLTTVLEGVDGDAHAEVDVLGETPSGTFLPIEGWQARDASQTIDLSPLARQRLKFRLRLAGGDLTPSPKLVTWSAGYQPVSDVVLTGVTAVPLEVEELEPVTLNVTLVNLGPLDRTFGATVAFYTMGGTPGGAAGGPPEGRLIGRVSVPETTQLGVGRTLSFLWDTATFPGEHTVIARLEDLEGNPSFFDRQFSLAQAVTVTPSGDADPPEVTITALDAIGEVRSGDFLPAESRFRIELKDLSGIDPLTFELVVTEAAGERRFTVGSPIVIEEAGTDTSLAIRTDLTFEDGHVEMVASGDDRLGNGPGTKAVSFQVTSDLAIERALNVPNPMSDQTAFTYVLSRPARVSIYVYTLSGRLIQRFEGLDGLAGYNQVQWNGLDGDGHALANGVYLYTVTAEAGDESVRVREKLMVYR